MAAIEIAYVKTPLALLSRVPTMSDLEIQALIKQLLAAGAALPPQDKASKARAHCKTAQMVQSSIHGLPAVFPTELEEDPSWPIHGASPTLPLFTGFQQPSSPQFQSAQMVQRSVQGRPAVFPTKLEADPTKKTHWCLPIPWASPTGFQQPSYPQLGSRPALCSAHGKCVHCGTEQSQPLDLAEESHLLMNFHCKKEGCGMTWSLHDGLESLEIWNGVLIGSYRELVEDPKPRHWVMHEIEPIRSIEDVRRWVIPHQNPIAEIRLTLLDGCI